MLECKRPETLQSSPVRSARLWWAHCTRPGARPLTRLVRPAPQWLELAKTLALECKRPETLQPSSPVRSARKWWGHCTRPGARPLSRLVRPAPQELGFAQTLALECKRPGTLQPSPVRSARLWWGHCTRPGARPLSRLVRPAPQWLGLAKTLALECKRPETFQSSPARSARRWWGHCRRPG